MLEDKSEQLDTTGIDISVVIPTYNRGGSVVNTLRSLERQTYKNFEVIIVNDGSTDNTVETLNALPAFPFLVRIIHQENRGRSGSRNTGFKVANAPIILSIDDDLIVEENCLALHVEHHKRYPGTILTGRVPDDIKAVETDFQRYKCLLSYTWEEELLELGYKQLSVDKFSITAANLSISKSLFWALGGFDERLNTNIDLELGFRALVKDIPVFFNPALIVWQRDKVTCKSYIKRKRQDPVGRKKLKEIHPEVIKLMPYYDHEVASNVPFWKWVAYGVLANRYLVQLIDSNSWFFSVMPEAMRYSIYSVVIHGLVFVFPNRDI